MKFNPQPKPLPKPKKVFGYTYWNEIKKKSFEKQKAKMKAEGKLDKDERFYRFLWNNRDRHCEECGRELKEFNKDIFHHLLKKSTHPYFRYEPKNIVLLCGKFGCHGKAESATSYPKMKIFEHCEKIKSELLESVGLTYESKITMP